MSVAWKSLSTHDFALKSSAQMARQESLELARTNTFLALSIHRNRQISCTGVHVCSCFCAFSCAVGRCVCVCVCVCGNYIGNLAANCTDESQIKKSVQFKIHQILHTSYEY